MQESVKRAFVGLGKSEEDNQTSSINGYLADSEDTLKIEIVTLRNTTPGKSSSTQDEQQEDASASNRSAYAKNRSISFYHPSPPAPANSKNM
ncbi:hypothetical protein TUM19329_14990 [Legionella antarctica]|uniref:Uncharacterized protein n=2 Tax=Legionella antarctica TaxID=2708020 RepID=A0A6F8T410_9GAMM|nr:hypothetical protein TUM19329_14990 [Legionella antarctica]